MRYRRTYAAIALTLPLMSACDSLGGGLTSDVLARAGGHELSTEDATRWLADQGQLPNQPEVVEALADLWIDYTLVAITAVEDSTLQNIDLMPIVRQPLEQDIVFRLREQVISVDTLFEEDELRERYVTEKPGASAHARHILLHYPQQSNDAQRDSVRDFLLELRERTLNGEDFADLARRYSRDAATGAKGGDLGFFEREEMVEPFSDAVFTLSIGEVSQPVETPYGMHLIKLENLEFLPFEEGRREFEAKLKTLAIQEAEAEWVGALEEAADVQVAPGAFDVVRELARRPGVQLTRRAVNRAIMTFNGGEYTAGEFQEDIQRESSNFQQGLSQAPDEELETFLHGWTRRELLVAAAYDAGFEVTDAQRDSLLAEAHNRFRIAITQMGLRGIHPQAGESVEDAIDRTVKDVMGQLLRGERDVVPLTTIGYSLRQRHRTELNQLAVAEVVERVAAIRPEPQAPPLLQPREAPPGTVPPNAPPGGTGGGSGGP